MIDSKTIDRALRAAAKPLLLEKTEQLLAAAENWHQQPILGIDTEFLRERTYRAQLGLVQVSDGISAWLVDTLQLENLQPLKAMFADASILKVFHSASEDLEVLWNTLGDWGTDFGVYRTLPNEILVNKLSAYFSQT